MRKIVAALMIILVTGCSTAHENVVEDGVTKEKVVLIKKGVTTGSELEELFGAPEMTLKGENGRESFYKDLNLRSVWVVIDENDVVTEFAWTE